MFELMELLLELCIDDCIFISHLDVGAIDQIFSSGKTSSILGTCMLLKQIEMIIIIQTIALILNLIH